MQVSFAVDGDVQVARTFEAADAWSRDMSEPLAEMMGLIVENVRAQFDTEGAQGEHGPWQPLSDQYAKWKATHFPGRPILVRTGGMKGAMLNWATAVTVGRDRAVYEPRSRIAPFHQKGAVWVGPAWGHGEYEHRLPARPMVDLPEAFKHEAVDRTFARWVTRKLAEGRAGAIRP